MFQLFLHYSQSHLGIAGANESHGSKDVLTVDPDICLLRPQRAGLCRGLKGMLCNIGGMLGMNQATTGYNDLFDAGQIFTGLHKGQTHHGIGLFHGAGMAATAVSIAMEARA